MKQPQSIAVLFLVLAIITQESLCLTMRALQNLPTENDKFYFPEVDERADTASAMDKTFVRTIGSVAGREIIPRRWTSEQRVDRVVVDEDGIAIPVRKNPLLSQILGRPGGL